MNINDISRQKLIEALLKSSGGKLQKEDVNRAAEGKDLSPLLGLLSAEERKKVSELASSREKIEELLKSPQSQQILRAVLKDGSDNGRNKR